MKYHMQFKKFRRDLRAKRNLASLNRERAHYDSIFAAKTLSIPDEATIKTAIQKEHPRLVSKDKGDLNILALYHHYNWENHSLKPALEKFGPVRHYDWCSEFDHQRKDWFGPLRAEMNRELVKRVRIWVQDEATDVIFTYLSGEQVFPETIQEMASLGVPIFNLALNDKESFVGKIRGGQAMGARDICRHFTLCWTSTEDALKKYCVEGALPLYLPEGANPEVHKPFDVERSIDVSFVGQCYGDRPAVIAMLRSEGIRIEAYGIGWPSGPLSIEEMVTLYSQSKINLGFGGVDSHQDAYCLKGRDFEIPMSGGFYLTEYHPELERVYRIGSEIATYSGTEDLIEKIRHFLTHPEETECIRKAGFERARSEHTWEMRFEKIFQLLGLISS